MSDEKDKYEKMSFRDAEAELINAIYEASAIVERLEYADTQPGKFYSGKVTGNGHHKRQRIAAFAAAVLRQSWRDKDELTEQTPSEAVDLEEEERQCSPT